MANEAIRRGSRHVAWRYGFAQPFIQGGPGVLGGVSGESAQFFGLNAGCGDCYWTTQVAFGTPSVRVVPVTQEPSRVVALVTLECLLVCLESFTCRLLAGGHQTG